jgi:hypothetical protein
MTISQADFQMENWFTEYSVNLEWKVLLAKDTLSSHGVCKLCDADWKEVNETMFWLNILNEKF